MAFSLTKSRPNFSFQTIAKNLCANSSIRAYTHTHTLTHVSFLPVVDYGNNIKNNNSNSTSVHIDIITINNIRQNILCWQVSGKNRKYSEDLLKLRNKHWQHWRMFAVWTAFNCALYMHFIKVNLMLCIYEYMAYFYCCCCCCWRLWGAWCLNT